MREKVIKTIPILMLSCKSLASAANLENLELNDYLCFRVIAGINDPKSVDKILSIPAQDFNLEEVNRVATACETARNYSSLHSKNVSNNVFDKKNSNQKTLILTNKCRVWQKSHPKAKNVFSELQSPILA